MRRASAVLALTLKNGPKVGNAAPRVSNGAVRIWLYAGNPENPPVLALLSSDNPRGAGNQQGSPLSIGHDPSETTRRTSAFQRMMIWSHLHGDMQGLQPRTAARPGGLGKIQRAKFLVR